MQVGDKVICVSNDYKEIPCGTVCIITHIHSPMSNYFLTIDNYEKQCKVFRSDFKLLSEYRELLIDEICK